MFRVGFSLGPVRWSRSVTWFLQTPKKGSASKRFIALSVHQVVESVLDGIPEDERLWVSRALNIWFHPLMFDTVNGGWINLLKVKRSGMLNRHFHPAPVCAYVIKGSWRYLEHDWIATEGSFVYAPPGETHTLVVGNNVEEMIAWFHVCGCRIYMDNQGKQVDYEDVHTKIRKTEDHARYHGLGPDFVKQMIR